MRRLVIGTVLSVALAHPCAALAQEAESPPRAPVTSEARTRFELAREAFERGDYAIALSEWERVYALMEGHPRRAYVLYNMARAHEELGREQQALEFYERYLSETGGDAPYRSEAHTSVNELRLRLELESASATTTDAAPTDEPSAEEQTGFSPSPIGIAIASVGAAAMIAGAIVGGLALAQDGDARATCVDSRCTPEAYAAVGEAHVLANAADGLLWGGLAVLATGAVLTFVLGATGSTEASAGCTGDGCMATLRGTF